MTNTVTYKRRKQGLDVSSLLIHKSIFFTDNLFWKRTTVVALFKNVNQMYDFNGWLEGLKKK
jgi:hypothetical protein